MERKYSPERMTNIGALLSLIQSVLFLGFILHFLELILSKDKIEVEEHRKVFHHLIESNKILFLALLVFAGLVHLSWLFSSVYLLIGNRNGNERSVSQYLIVTSVVSLVDIIFPFIVLPTTFSVFGKALSSQSIQDDGEPVLMKETHFGQYFWLLMVFIRGGCFTFLIDMFSLQIAYQRFASLHDLRMKIRGNPGLGIKETRLYPLDDDMDKRRPSSDMPTFQVEEEIDTSEQKPKPAEKTETTYVPEQQKETAIGEDPDEKKE